MNMLEVSESLTSRPGKYKFDYAKVKLWVQWRKDNGRAKYVGEIDWHGKTFRMWTLDPDNETETDLSKIRSAYIRPRNDDNYSMRRYDQEDEGKCCSSCKRPLNEREIILRKRPF